MDYIDWINISYHDLPGWIQTSELCQIQSEIVRINNDFNDNDNHFIHLSCPRQYSYFSLDIQSCDDIERLLRIIQYWGVSYNDTPFEILDYILNYPSSLSEIENSSKHELLVIEYYKNIIEPFQYCYNTNMMPSNDSGKKNCIIYDIMKVIRCIYRFIVRRQIYDIQISQSTQCHHARSINLDNLLEYAILKNNFRFVQYVIEYKDSSLNKTSTLTLLASKYGYLSILRYLHLNHFPWNASCIRWAVKNNHSSCLAYLRLNKCMWRDPTENEVVAFKHTINSQFKDISVIISLLDETSIDIDMPAQVGGPISCVV